MESSSKAVSLYWSLFSTRYISLRIFNPLFIWSLVNLPRGFFSVSKFNYFRVFCIFVISKIWERIWKTRPSNFVFIVWVLFAINEFLALSLWISLFTELGFNSFVAILINIYLPGELVKFSLLSHSWCVLSANLFLKSLIASERTFSCWFFALTLPQRV